MKKLIFILMVASGSCKNQPKEFTVVTEFGTVKAFNYAGVDHHSGDTVFVRQVLDSGADSKWEVLPSLDYKEGINKERYLFSRADRTGTDTFYIGIQYRLGVIK